MADLSPLDMALLAVLVVVLVLMVGAFAATIFAPVTAL